METKPPAQSGRSNAVAWLATASVIITGFALVAFLETCHTTGNVAKAGAETAGKITTTIDHGIDKAVEAAAKFKTGTITHTFVEQNTEVSSTKGDILELGTIRQDETFAKEDSRYALWDTVNLGTTSSEIRVPVTFRYHLRLSDAWKLATRDNVCVVLAPQFKASQPPAIHTDQMVKSTASGWARFDGGESLENLERGITPALELRANDRNHRALAREANRQAVAEFVRKWLMREDRWREDRFTSIVVVFPDETKIDSDDDLAKLEKDPTVHLDKKN